ncbi:MAG: hypothetical protein AAF438_13135 [Pseudomonadota bacterium]
MIKKRRPRDFHLLPKSKCLLRLVPQTADIKYLVRLSPEPDPNRVLVLVHGISRSPSFMIQCLAERADRENFSLVAPIFSHRTFDDYQRLGRLFRGQRADLALLRILEDAKQWTGLPESYHLFGFSGGAQFCHRFVMTGATQIRSLTLASAGWYTDPSSEQRYPYGVGRSDSLPVQLMPERLYRTPTLVLVGENDIQQDAALVGGRVDQAQGKNRMLRAVWFHSKLAQHAQAAGLDTQHLFDVLPNTGHDFVEATTLGGLVDRLFDFCTSPQSNNQSVASENSEETELSSI